MPQAGELLAAQPRRALRAELRWSEDDEAELHLEAGGMTRADLYFDGRPVESIDLPCASPGSLRQPATAQVLEIRGFDGEKLVARRLLPRAGPPDG